MVKSSRFLFILSLILGVSITACLSEAQLSPHGIQNEKKGKCEIITSTAVASNASETAASCYELAKSTILSNKVYLLREPLDQPIRIVWDGKNIFGSDRVNGFKTRILLQPNKITANYLCQIELAPGVASERRLHNMIRNDLSIQLRHVFVSVNGPSQYAKRPNITNVGHQMLTQCEAFIEARTRRYRGLLRYVDGQPANFKVLFEKIDLTPYFGKP